MDFKPARCETDRSIIEESHVQAAVSQLHD